MNEGELSHLSDRERRAVYEFLRRLYDKFPDQILHAILFGSKARGDSGLWSDIDVLVVVREESWPMRSEVSTVAARVSYEHDVLIGPRVIGAARWERMKRGRFGLYENIIAEGVPLATVPAS